MQSYKTNIEENALQGFANGIDRATRIVRGTMGAAGHNVVLESEQPPFNEVSNDGATIIERLWFENPLENMALNFLKELVSRSNYNAGDGSSTTCVLLDAILKEGQKYELKGIEVKKSLDACIPIIEQAIKQQTHYITTDDILRLKQIATIAGEDEEMGKLLAEIYSKIGKEGIIHPEYILGKEGNSYEYTQGVRFAYLTGYLSPYMVHDEEAIKENRSETKAIYKNPIILVTKQPIRKVKEIDPIVKFAQLKERDLVIFTDNMDSGIASLLISAHRQKKMDVRSAMPHITVIKAPTVWKDFVFEDFAKCVGANIVEDSAGINFKDFTSVQNCEKYLGTCDKIIIEANETRILGTANISDHIQNLEEKVANGDTGNNDYARRLSWLKAKNILLKIGGLTETELSWKRMKLEDAINATRSALEEGFVAGAGICLLKTIESLPDTLGGTILAQAFTHPYRQIISNANITDKVLPTDGETGYDVTTGKLANLIESGIIDSATVVLNAAKNAIGLASTVLTTNWAITLPPKAPPIMQNQPFYVKG